MAPKNFKQNPVESFFSEETKQKAEKKAENYAIPTGYKLVRNSKSARLQLLVRPDTKAFIKEYAEENGHSMNDLVNRILEDFVKENRK